MSDGSILYRLPKPPVPDYGDLLVRIPEPNSENPNQWFAKRFPEATEKYGPAFLEAFVIGRFNREFSTPLHFNDDFFASILCGNKRLGYSVVYFPPEDQFYFFDYQIDAFVPVSEKKLQVVISNYFIRVGRDCGDEIDLRNLVAKFRYESQIETIISKAKAIGEVDKSFFVGKNGNRRFIDGRFIEADAEPSYTVFVKSFVIRDDTAVLTVANAYMEYHRFCRGACLNPLKRGEFKLLMAGVIQELFDLGLRHDILADTGKETHGWDGLRCSEMPAQLALTA